MPPLGEVVAKAGLLIAVLVLGLNWQSGAGGLRHERSLAMAIDPARFGMPDATTAGVQPNTTLRAYTGPMNITTDGTVIENVIINGTLSVKAAERHDQELCHFRNSGLCGASKAKARRTTFASFTL